MRTPSAWRLLVAAEPDDSVPCALVLLGKMGVPVIGKGRAPTRPLPSLPKKRRSASQPAGATADSSVETMRALGFLDGHASVSVNEG